MKSADFPVVQASLGPQGSSVFPGQKAQHVSRSSGGVGQPDPSTFAFMKEMLALVLWIPGTSLSSDTREPTLESKVESPVIGLVQAL